MLAQMVVDAAPLLSSTGSAQSLRNLARSLVTTRAVLGEVRDKTSRELLERIGWITADGKESDDLAVREPSPEAVGRVLSQTDLAVLALTLTLELEVHGSKRIRLAPGQQSEQEKERSHAAFVAREARRKAKAAAPQVELVAEKLEKLQTEEPTDNAPVEEQGDDSDEGEWITPDNVELHKSRDLGLFPSLNPDAPLEIDANGEDDNLVACMTGDYAMQNILLQMGLGCVGVGGKRISQVRTWVLRCHACFKLCKDPTKKFCPSCGGNTLIRTSITYCPPSAAHPQGYVLHLKSNFRHNNRGTIFSVPRPLPGSSRGQLDGRTDLILREDQKEWQRGVKRSDIAKRKEEKALAKAIADPRSPEARFGSAWADPDRVAKAVSDRRGERLGTDGLPIIGVGRRNPNRVLHKKG